MALKPKSRPDKRAAAAVPQTLAECEALIAELRGHRQTLKQASDVLDTHIRELKDRAAREAAPIEIECVGLLTRIQAYCEANRKTLTDNGATKTVKLKFGWVSWRKGRTHVVLEGDEADILVSLRAMKLKRFIRTVEEIDKAEMLRAPAQARTVPGVSIVDGVESFSVQTSEE